MAKYGAWDIFPAPQMAIVHNRPQKSLRYPFWQASFGRLFQIQLHGIMVHSRLHHATFYHI